MSLAMTPRERADFLAGVHVAVVSVADENGRGPLSVPLWYEYEPGGELSIVTDRLVSIRVHPEHWLSQDYTKLS